VLPALLFVVTIALYAPVAQFEFLNYDDEDYVTHNLRVQEGLSSRSVWWALTSLDASNWHPLTWLSLQLDAEIFGLKHPGGFHLTSALLHAINVVILYCFLRETTGSTWRSAFVAALFGWHPLRVESVAWVAERKDVLSALFWLLTMLAYARYAKRASAGRYVITILLFAAGLLAKPMLITLPAVMLLLDYWPLGRLSGPNRKGRQALWLIFEKFPFAALSTASIAVTLVAQQHGSAINAISFSLRWRNAIVSYVIYLRKMFWPVDALTDALTHQVLDVGLPRVLQTEGLAVFYPHPINGRPYSAVIAAALLLIAITVIVLWCYARRPYMAVGWFWYVISILPVIGLIQVGAQAYADRYTYLPMIGIYLMLSWGLADVLLACRCPTPVTGALAVVALLACLATTWQQLEYWRDSVSLWRHTVSVAPPSYVGELNYGAALAEVDRRNESTKNWPLAKLHFERAMHLDEAPAGAYLDYALGMARVEHYTEAIHYFQKALAVRPSFPQAHNSLGKLLLDLGRKDEAIEQFRLAIKERPDYSMYHHNLGIALQQKGERAQAAKELEKALTLDPAQEALRRAGSTSR
jgi:tetratricopeptide (TPR) repeat protein